ncbi:hypothetical protein M405DRAFT_867528 [Rhizopogon salebrosus TDB-379]|nr:hypothetical protein M405DRAFT_867528 [Rhizopogon salebrosus TDB-379]
MPKPKAKMNKHHRLNALGRSMTELHHEFRSRERKERVKHAGARYKANLAHEKRQDLIPKPKGRAGRRDGYKLIVAMGMEERKEHYNALVDRVHMLADKYLNEHATISGQDKLLVQKVIRKGRLGDFENEGSQSPMPTTRSGVYSDNGAHSSSDDDTTWYGINTDANFRGQNRQRSESESEGSDPHLNTSTRHTKKVITASSKKASRELVSKPATHKRSNQVVLKKKKSLNAPVTLTLKSSNSSKKKVKVKELDIPAVAPACTSEDEVTPRIYGDSSEAEDGLVPLRRLRRFDEMRSAPTPSPTATRQVRFIESEEQSKTPPPQFDWFQVATNNNKPEHFGGDSSDLDDELEPLDDLADNENDNTVSSDDIPTTCTERYCNDAVPRSMSSKLYDALEQYTKLTRVQMYPTVQSMTLSISICTMIKADIQREVLLRDALDNGWPVLDIDFSQIPDRISNMKPLLDSVMFDPHQRLEKLPSFIDFKDDMCADGLTVDRLANMASILDRNSKVLANSQPGYYGPKGKAIIKATLLRKYPPEITPTDAFRPLNTEKYLEYFVVRLVGNELIREDLGLNSQDSDSDARSIAVRTVLHGTYLNPQEDDDEELDNILHRIMLGVWDDRRAREKAQDAEEKRRARDEATLRDVSMVNEDEATLRDAAADGLMQLFTDGGKAKKSVVEKSSLLHAGPSSNHTARRKLTLHVNDKAVAKTHQTRSRTSTRAHA